MIGETIELLLKSVAVWADYRFDQPRHWWSYPLIGLLLVPLIVTAALFALAWFLD